MDAQRFNTLLLNGATKVLMAKEIPNTTLSRLSSLILFSIQNFQDRSVETLGPLFQLLHHLDNNGVSEMFTAILSQEPIFSGLQKLMVEADFATIVINTISNTNEDTMPYILMVVRIASLNPILSKNFHRTDVAKALLDLIPTQNIHIQNELWRAITALLSTKTVSVLRDAIAPAIEIVGDSYLTLNMFRIFAFDFLGKIILNDSSAIDLIVEGQVLEISMRLILQFSNCSNLIASIFRFYNNGFAFNVIRDWMVISLVPFLVVNASTNEHTAAVAYSYNFLTFLCMKSQSDIHLSKSLSAVSGYTTFVKNILIPYNTKMSEKYGGGFVDSPKRRNSQLFVD